MCILIPSGRNVVGHLTTFDASEMPVHAGQKGGLQIGEAFKGYARDAVHTVYVCALRMEACRYRNMTCQNLLMNCVRHLLLFLPSNIHASLYANRAQIPGCRDCNIFEESEAHNSGGELPCRGGLKYWRKLRRRLLSCNTADYVGRPRYIDR